MYEAVSINIMEWKDNQIFKKRQDYDDYIKLDGEDNFDEHDHKYLRRSQSYEDFRDHDETFAPNKLELLEEKYISYPPSPRQTEKIGYYPFSDQIEDIRDKLKSEYAFNNLYADSCYDEFDPEDELEKMRARRIQTYGKDIYRYGHKTGYDEDKEDAGVDPDMAQSILDGIIGNLSDEDNQNDEQLIRRNKRERLALAHKRKMGIPDFAIEDIMGEFVVDDRENFVILRNDENGDLEDRNDKHAEEVTW